MSQAIVTDKAADVIVTVKSKKSTKKKAKKSNNKEQVLKAWIAFREYNPKWAAKINSLVVLITGSTIFHTEVVFSERCLGKQCPLALHPHLGCPAPFTNHRVAYTIASGGMTDNQLYRDVDRRYKEEGGWRWVKLLLAPGQIEQLKSFCVYHHMYSRGYNLKGMYFNFLFGTEFGAKRADCKGPLKGRPWFCSEFAAGGLLYAGVDIPVQPCHAFPSFLYHYLLDNKLGEFEPTYAV